MTLNKVLRWVALGALFLVPFIPLVVTNNMFFPFITGKNFAFRILIEIAFGSWLILALRDREYLPKKSWILWGFIAFLVVIAIADMGSENPHKSFWSNFERMEGYVTMIHLFAYFLVASAILKTKKLWGEFIHLNIIASAFVTIYSFLQLIGVLAIHQGATRLDATLGNSAYLAIYMVFNAFMYLFLLVKYLKEKQGTPVFRWYVATLLAVGALAETLVVYFTATRGAILGMAVALVVMSIILAIKETNRLIKRISIGIISVIVLLGIIFVLIKNTSFVQKSPVLSRFSDLATLNVGQILSTDGESRVEIWTMALKGIEERPILGWGQESFNYLFYKYYNPNMYNQEPWFDRAHDVVLDWLVNAGVLGLITYILFFITAFYYLIKNKGNMMSLAERAVLIGLFIAYFIHNIFVFDNITSYIMFFGLLAYLQHVYGTKMKDATETKITGLSHNTYAITASIIAVVIVFGIYFFNVKGIEASTSLTVALTDQSEAQYLAQNGQTSNAVDFYQQADTEFQNVIDLNSFGQPEVREYLTEFAIGIPSVSALDNTTKSGIYNFALTQMKDQVAETPNDVRYYYFLEHLYLAFGDLNDALPVVQKAITLSPDKQLLLFDLGNIYVNAGQNSLALPVFKNAYDLAPADDDARIYYAMSAIIAGDQSLADSLLVPAYGTDLYPDQRIILAYQSAKQYSKVIAILKGEIASSAADPSMYVALAQAYYLNGQTSLAVSTLKALETLDPNDKAQIDAYITQVETGKTSSTTK